MYSFVIKIGILVKRAVLHEIILPAPGLINPIVELPIADPDPIKISVIINNIFFLFTLLQFSILLIINLKYSHDHVFPFDISDF